MNASKFLGKVIGIYLIFISVSMLINMNQFATNITNLINDSSLMLVTGYFTIILGILLVVSHNIWQWNWRVIITIIAWMTLIKGASLILYPQFIDKTSLMFIHNMNIAYVTASLDFFLGVLLVYCGFKR